MPTTTTTPKNGQADAAPPDGATLNGLLTEVLDLENYARSVLDLVYNAQAMLQYGLDEKSKRHVEAASVMLDYLCQEHLNELLGTVEEMATVARAHRPPLGMLGAALTGAASGDGATSEPHLATETGPGRSAIG